MHPETIRFYERSGLLPPPPRSAAGHRQFPPAAVEQLLLIKKLRQLGFSLAEIRRLLAQRSTSAPLAAELERQLADLDHRLSELRDLLATTDY